MRHATIGGSGCSKMDQTRTGSLYHIPPGDVLCIVAATQPTTSASRDPPPLATSSSSVDSQVIMEDSVRYFADDKLVRVQCVRDPTSNFDIAQKLRKRHVCLGAPT